MRRQLLTCLIILSFVLGLTRSVFAISYTYTTIDVPGASDTFVFGVNDAGQMVGHYYDASGQHGFSLSGGSFSTIDFPGASVTVANGINDTGQTVGYYRDGSMYRGFLLTSGSFSTIDYPGAEATFVFKINDTGQIVGWYDDWVSGVPSSGVPHGFSLTGSSFSTIDFPGALDTHAYGINDTGQIVGEYGDVSGDHGYLLTGGSFSAFNFPGASLTEALGINDTGQIVGWYEDTIGRHGFSLIGGSFSTIDFPGATSTFAHGVNDNGKIVGFYEDASGFHGFVATSVQEVCDNGIDDDGDGLVDCDDPDCVGNPACPTEEDLLEKYAPILYMHPKEKYHPTKVENMLANSRLYEAVEIIKKQKKTIVGVPVIVYPLNLATLMTNTYNKDKYYLKLKNKPKNWKKEQTVYGREIKLSSNVRVLQYWFFYVFNDWGGLIKGGNKHEGDWEMIQIIIFLNNAQPDQITYSMHHGGLPLQLGDSEVMKHDEHPLVFVTLGGHGSWNKPGNHLWYQDYCVQCTDETSSEGDILAPKNVSITSDYKYELINLDEVDWVYWNGYWGNQAWLKKTDILDIGSSGPASPPYINYKKDDGIEDGRWEDPISWGYNPNPSGYIICASANSKIIAHDMKGNIERLLIHCLPVPECGWCSLIKVVYTEKDLVFDVYSRDGKEVDLRISRYKKSKEMYEVEFKGLDITRTGKASLTFSPELNPNFEMKIDKDPEGYYESYKLPDCLEVKEVDE